MTKLLSANFKRLAKDRIFWLGAIFTAVFSLFLCGANYMPAEKAEQLPLDTVFFIFYACFCLVCAVIISLFVGTEYSDGTIRNKLVIGHNRINIYFSNLITSIAACSVMIVIHSVLTLSVGHFLFSQCQMSKTEFAYIMMCIFLVTAVYCAICVMIAMNCQNKAVTAVVTILLMIILVYMATFVNQRLMEPEMTYDGYIISQNGIEYGDIIKNPAYISGTLRKILEFIYNLLPTGQIQQIYSLATESSAYWPFMSLGLFAVLSAAGAFLFKKKDLK